jgi:hypothetical protein
MLFLRGDAGTASRVPPDPIGAQGPETFCEHGRSCISCPPYEDAANLHPFLLRLELDAGWACRLLGIPLHVKTPVPSPYAHHELE